MSYRALKELETFNPDGPQGLAHGAAVTGPRRRVRVPRADEMYNVLKNPPPIQAKTKKVLGRHTKTPKKTPKKSTVRPASSSSQLLQTFADTCHKSFASAQELVHSVAEDCVVEYGHRLHAVSGFNEGGVFLTHMHALNTLSNIESATATLAFKRESTVCATVNLRDLHVAFKSRWTNADRVLIDVQKTDDTTTTKTVPMVQYVLADPRIDRAAPDIRRACYTILGVVFRDQPWVDRPRESNVHMADFVASIGDHTPRNLQPSEKEDGLMQLVKAIQRA